MQKTITLQVRPGYALRQRLGWRDGPAMRAVEVEAGAGLESLYEALGIAPEAVAFSTVNNAYPPADYRLQAGDVVRVMSHSVGG